MHCRACFGPFLREWWVKRHCRRAAASICSMVGEIHSWIPYVGGYVHRTAAIAALNERSISARTECCRVASNERLWQCSRHRSEKLQQRSRNHSIIEALFAVLDMSAMRQ